MFAAVTGQELPSGVSVSAVTPEVLLRVQLPVFTSFQDTFTAFPE